jgi:hypothetical protein
VARKNSHRQNEGVRKAHHERLDGDKLMNKLRPDAGAHRAQAIKRSGRYWSSP